MFDPFGLLWPEGMEEALVVTALMEDGEPVCPICGSREFEETDENRIRCEVCGTTFRKR